MQDFSFLTCFLLLYLSLVTDSIIFRDCGSQDVSVIALDLYPCESEPCVLVRKKNVDIEIQFITFTHAEGHKIHLSSSHGPQVLKLPQNDVCAQVTPSCPIEKGKIYTLRYRVMVAKNSPLGPLAVRLELVHKSGGKFMCIEIPVKVV
ncbi:Phosphatidylglycerol/phosphatidylinositol transfer protein [Clonorchis sinensis]|uniref:Phosphatidylglycerol/phosphatidylinositol transfer protein n=1 Tax=Clonorchis sinensis TaxID=79923 RepID=A0A8T1MZZ5_CLOSI|nr:Phosphatidylglycerol/phosphatidylinositol transfer protein [Clonorchis sinensis]